MIYLLTISKKNPPDSKTIERLVRIHTTPTIDVIKKYVDDELPNGFVIDKKDSMLTYMVKNDIDLKETLDKKQVEVLVHEKIRLADAAKHSKDRSITKGEKPYAPVK
jgi:hypothetical protein